MLFPTCWGNCIFIYNVHFRGFRHPEEWATYSMAHSFQKLYLLFCIFYYCSNIKITISQLKKNGSRLRKCCHLTIQSSWKTFFNRKSGSRISVKQSFHFNVILSSSQVQPLPGFNSGFNSCQRLILSQVTNSVF